jgi:phosphoadenosine phosphosulfate reductase
MGTLPTQSGKDKMNLDDKIQDTFFKLKQVSAEFPSKIAFSSSLGEEDQVLTWFIAKFRLPIAIFTLDTGRLFNESYELLSRTENKYQIAIDLKFPEAAEIQSLVNNHGINGFYKSLEARKACCGIRKINPLKKALQPFEAWVTGLRSEQSLNRSQVQFRAYDPTFNLEKINPLHHWTYEEIRTLIDRENIPTNPLHSKGFVSIGCAPCTRAIEPGEHPRNGRWWWENSQKECGLHHTNSITK